MKYLVAVLAVMFAALTVAHAQRVYLGFGPTYSVPTRPLDTTTMESFGGAVVIGSRKYCHLWAELRAGYTALRRSDTSRPLFYEHAVTLSPSARWFPVEPTSLPFYVQGMVSASRIGGSDSASVLGLGLGGGVGYLLFYDSNCCGWFADLYAQYQAPNLLLRSDRRPSLESVVLGLNINFSL